MILLHTADWHLGQTFYEYDRKAEHLYFLAWLRTQIRALQADVLLIAGDVFDSPNPPAESQKMFYRFLREATSEHPPLQIVIIAGNHDSAARLEAPDPLLEEMHVHIRGTVRRTPDGAIDASRLLIPLTENGRTAAWCIAAPYLRQGDCPPADSYVERVGKMYRTLYMAIPDRTLPVVAMGHLQAAGSEISRHDRSEYALVGGLECVSPDAFPPEIAYTALGHLHRAQRVSGRDNVRYAGAPLPMSFAEREYRQGVTLVELREGKTRVERIDFQPLVGLLSIPQTPLRLADVLYAIDLLPDGEITPRSPYLEINVMITEPEPSLRHRIEEALQGKSVRLARIAAVTPQQKNEPETVSCEQLQTIHPMDMATDVFRRRFGGEDMPGEMRELLQTVIREVGS
ncbi:MAG: exonuclease SbcCD subunit D C-terminal domain-containing protein [Tannerella sp.]|jgi:exonuclease SbcD|nr:exonuclease SbcCD subunit D C-terminal domain-containing protein [Tannerella sp.]